MSMYYDSKLHKGICVIGLIVWVLSSVISSVFLAPLVYEVVQLFWLSVVLEIVITLIVWFAFSVMISGLLFVGVMFPIGLLDGYAEHKWYNKQEKNTENND